MSKSNREQVLEQIIDSHADGLDYDTLLNAYKSYLYDDYSTLSDAELAEHVQTLQKDD